MNLVFYFHYENIWQRERPDDAGNTLGMKEFSGKRLVS
jgi:hypothetical protein